MKTAIKKTLKPIAFLPLFRIFSIDKVIKSSILNKLGIQPFRVWLAEKRYQMKPVNVPSDLTDEYNDLREQGITQINNFLDYGEFSKLRDEVKEIIQKEGWHRQRQDGPNLISFITVFELDLNKYPCLKKFTLNDKINRLFSVAERKSINMNKRSITVQIQHLIQGHIEGAHDPETDLHEDTFFNTHKAWLYLNDVKLETGPFVYVPRSHNSQDADRFNKVYKYTQQKGITGSRRISEEELKEVNLSEKVYTCDENTFVMANTLGYHRRLDGVQGEERLTIAVSARFNPFL